MQPNGIALNWFVPLWGANLDIANLEKVYP